MTKIKICGLTIKEQVEVTQEVGADYIGFVFAKSKRKIEPEKVAIITQDLSPHIKKVGVFVSPSVIELENTIKTAKLDVIQLHGELTKELQKILDSSFFKDMGVETIQAFNGQKEILVELINESQADYILLDAPAEATEYAGGNGLIFDWEETAKKIKKLAAKKIFIAGGLTADNVNKAIRIFNPFAVDVSSGVETNGQKDSKKIKAFIEAVRNEKNV